MYFIGDTHGVRPIFSIIAKHKLVGQNLIHVGDLGLGFQPAINDIKNLETLDEMLLESDNQLYVIRGNHDNPIFWDKGLGLWLPKLHNVHLMEDFTWRTIEGKQILFAGGAVSIDRLPRQAEHPPSWWEGEKFTYDKVAIDKALSQMTAVDIVVTHDCPAFAYPQNDYVPLVDHYVEIEKHHGFDLRAELREERSLITDFYKDITNKGFKPSHWLYGHFHSTKKQKIEGTEFKLLNINELYEIK